MAKTSITAQVTDSRVLTLSHYAVFTNWLYFTELATCWVLPSDWMLQLPGSGCYCASCVSENQGLGRKSCPSQLAHQQPGQSSSDSVWLGSPSPGMQGAPQVDRIASRSAWTVSLDPSLEWTCWLWACLYLSPDSMALPLPVYCQETPVTVYKALENWLVYFTSGKACAFAEFFRHFDILGKCHDMWLQDPHYSNYSKCYDFACFDLNVLQIRKSMHHLGSQHLQ